MTNPITASRERIICEALKNHHLPEDSSYTSRKWLDSALLQHEAVVREEMKKQFRKFQFRYVITGDEIKYSGGPERLSKKKEYLERDLFRQLGDNILS